MEEEDVVDREPTEQHGTAELGSEADSGDTSEFPSADLVYGRIPITDVSPVVEGGRFPATAIPGEDIRVSATVFREGHDSLGASAVLYDPQGREVQRVTMTPGEPGTDSFHALLRPGSVGSWSFAIEGWSDLYDTWLHAAEIKIGVGQDVELMFKEGQLLFEAASKESSRSAEESRAFENAAARMADTSLSVEDRLAAGTSDEVKTYVTERPLRDLLSSSQRYPIEVEREAAGRGSWYEFFPRSEGATWDAEAGQWISGNFRTAVQALDRAADMGFDVAYLPPIHPIGRDHRKGPNNSLEAGPQDPGSPWAIGSPEGGHDAIHPDLGTFEDFDAFVAHAHDLGLEVALDLALQASPDHPWVKEHPQWFTTRADGTIAYAENPPKKYQDIYPLNFDNDPQGLAHEVLRVVELWISHGVDIFRVDNPHTKPLWFWEWLIAQVRAETPEVVFLAEAFTRPAMMHALGRVGFQQSYGYFTWRNTREELEEYLEEVTQQTAGFYRPNFFVNTPDILTEYLQTGGPGAFRIRAVVAAMSNPLWGVYAGFELFEHVPRPGAEEYIDSEKYEYRPRDWAGAEAAGQSLAPYLTRLNEIRAEHPALRDLQNLTLHSALHSDVLVFSKRRAAAPEGIHADAAAVTDAPAGTADDVVLVTVTCNPHEVAESTLELDFEALGVRDEDRDEQGRIEVEDLLTGQRWHWDERPYVRLDPSAEPAHILRIVRG